ncbi:MAG: hypothetical protein WD906_07155 [Anaerolineales bacterium]
MEPRQASSGSQTAIVAIVALLVIALIAYGAYAVFMGSNRDGGAQPTAEAGSTLPIPLPTLYP